MKHKMARPVQTKWDFVPRFLKGEFGNTTPSWGTVKEYKESNYCHQLVHVRNRIPRGVDWPNVAPTDLDLIVTKALAMGYMSRGLYFSWMGPDHLKTFQGEVSTSHRHVDLSYTLLRLPMRLAFNKQRINEAGLRAIRVLKYYMSSVSYDWLCYLFDEYPGHVVEFSTYSVCWGTVPGFDTVFWEVRNY